MCPICSKPEFLKCDGCGEQMCQQCYKGHVCAVLTDRWGREVKVGDILYYGFATNPEKYTYTVAEILPSFTLGQTCYGTNKSGDRIIIRPRLMLRGDAYV